MSRCASTAFFTTRCCLGLAGCGGGATLEDPPPPPPANDYETIYSAAAATSNMRGIGLGILQTGQEANTIPLLVVSGSVRHDVGPLSLDDGQYAFAGTMHYVDLDDPDQRVRLSDGKGGVFFLSEFEGGTFKYVLRYNGEYRIGQDTYSSLGFSGIVTAADDVPSSGISDYSGVAFGSGATVACGSFELLSGTATATVNFLEKTLSLIAGGFSDVGAPVDDVRVAGALIDGASFGGGAISLMNGDASADGILRLNIQSQFGGSFYGYDDALQIPDELGGMLLKAGDDGFVAVYIAAD